VAQLWQNNIALFISKQLLGLTLLIGAARDMTPQALASDLDPSTQNRFSLLAAHTCVFTVCPSQRFEPNDEIIRLSEWPRV